MTCKSHALLLVFAILGIVPGIWGAVADPTAAHACIELGARSVERAVQHYRCGLGPFFLYAFGFAAAWIALLVGCLVASQRRSARIERAMPTASTPAITVGVLLRTRRVHRIALVLGVAAALGALALDSFGCCVALAALTTILAARNNDCTLALDRIQHGAAATRRAEALTVAGGRLLTIHAARWIFRAAERTVVPVARVAIR